MTETFAFVFPRFRTMTTVANSFRGYQYYEFALLKDLTQESRKLADQTSQLDPEDG